MEFSYNGKVIACQDTINQVVIVDAYDGGILSGLIEPDKASPPIYTHFTPDSDFMVIGMLYKVGFWDWNNSKEITLQEHHAKKVTAVYFNPEFLMIITACQNIILWIPDFSEEGESRR